MLVVGGRVAEHRLGQRRRSPAAIGGLAERQPFRVVLAERADQQVARRIAMRAGDELHAALLVHHMDRAPVGEVGHADPRQVA